MGRVPDPERKAYVCDLTADEIRDGRGTLTRPGAASNTATARWQKNLDLFRRMRAGEFPDGTPRAPGPDRHELAET